MEENDVHQRSISEFPTKGSAYRLRLSEGATPRSFGLPWLRYDPEDLTPTNMFLARYMLTISPRAVAVVKNAYGGPLSHLGPTYFEWIECWN